MPLEALILRRVFPVPVTDADNARANEIMADAGEHPMDAFAWHAAIKDATGALDEVYAVIDGHEVRVATVADNSTANILSGGPRIGALVNTLMTQADEAGYWQRPHEIMHTLEESQMSHATMKRVAENSMTARAK